MVSNKVYLAILVIAVSVTVFAMLVATNQFGLGKTFAGAGGPLAANAYNFLVGFPKWVINGGWPTLIVGFLVATVIPAAALAYATWHYDLPLRVTGAASSASPASGYDNTMKREPDEPERGVKPA
jgi:hypothetical protein